MIDINFAKKTHINSMLNSMNIEYILILKEIETNELIKDIIILIYS